MKLTNTVPKIAVALAALAAIGAGAGVTAIASAQSTTSTSDTTAPRQWMKGPHGMGDHGVHGTVSAINGTSMTITNTDGTSYTVDASNAKVTKIVELGVSDIKVGDTVGVMGQVSGTSVTAQHIMDGVPPKPQAPPSDN